MNRNYTNRRYLNALTPHGRKRLCYTYKADQDRLVRLSGLRINSPTVHRRAGKTPRNHSALEDVQGSK
jgi:hypothetical protein